MTKHITKIIVILALVFSSFPLPTLAATQKNVPSNTNLVAYWTFDAGRGTKAVDGSGNGLTATLNGGVTWTTGKHGNALRFDGNSGSYVSIANFPAQSNFTIAFWMKPSRCGGAETQIFDSVDDNIGVSCTGGLVGSWNASTYPSSAANTIATSTWVHVAVSRGPSTTSIYINGQPSGSGSSGNSINFGTAYIGSVFGGTRNFTGIIDDFRIYNTNLAASQIASLYSTGVVTKVVANNTGLVGQWSFDAGKGLKAIDSSGNGNTGTLNGSLAWVSGKHGNALSFNSASSQYVSLASGTIADGSDMTVVAWVKPTAIAQQAFVSNWSAGTSLTGFDMSMNTSGKLRCAYGNGTSTTFFTATTLTLAANQWNLVACVRNTGSTSVIPYLNGAAGSAMTLTGNATGLSVTGARFGQRGDTGDKYTGLMDDVRIYNRALSLAEIVNLYNSGQVTKNVNQNSKNTNGLVGFWSFNGPDTTATTATDVSGSSNTLTFSGGVVKSAGKVGQALSFDGSSGYLHITTFSGPPSSRMTLCTWMKTPGTGATQFILNINRNPGNIVNEGIWQININGKLHFWDYTGSAYGFVDPGTESNTAVTDNKWHFACFVKNNTAGTYYLDGAANGAVTALSSVSYGSADWSVGKDYRDGGSYFNGSLDDLRIYNRALSATEIAALYAAGK